MKHAISTLAERNRIMERIIQALANRRRFLLLCHRVPDEDSLGSMVALALLLDRMSKPVGIALQEHVSSNFDYLLSIARYNGIEVGDIQDVSKVDTFIVCDTPKPEMIGRTESLCARMVASDTITIELDHHLGSDSDYIGDEEYRLVTEATSTGELVALLLYKMRANPALVDRFQLGDVFSRNIVLAILTGMIGDTQMGRFLKTSRERRFYALLTAQFEAILAKKTFKRSNFAGLEDIFEELRKLSEIEERCYKTFSANVDMSAGIGSCILDTGASAEIHSEFDIDTVGNAARRLADDLAEKSGTVSLIGFVDNPNRSQLVQFRARRSHDFDRVDLRDLLQKRAIANGGGHPGAIAFRFDRQAVADVAALAAGLRQDLVGLVAAAESRAPATPAE
jgi:nanoRNase/pAp phosphatase (c-di-AMP/oligoRNAs hydrolase)